MTEAVLGIKIDSRQVDEAGLKLDDLKASAQQAEGATKGLSSKFKEMKGTLDPLFAIQSQYERGLRTVRKEQAAGNLTLEQATKATTELYNRQKLLTEQMTGVGKSFRKLRGTAGQLGFQLQDIAVQAQAGTDAFIIFSQQGSQIASAFGPGGAVLGAIIAIGGAVGGALVNSLSDATDGLDEFESKMESVIGSLNRVQLEKINNQIKAQKEVIQEALNEYNKLSNQAPETLSVIQKLFLSQEELRERQRKQIEESVESSSKAYKNLINQQEALLELEKERDELLGLVSDETKKTASDAERYIVALQKQVATQGKSKAETLAYTASLMKFNEEQQQTVDGLLSQVDAYEKRIVAEKKAAKAAKEAQKQAIKDNKKVRKSYQDIMDSVDPLGAKIRKAGERIKELYDQVEQRFLTKKEADAAAKVIGDTLTDLFEKNKKVRKSYQDIMDSVDPLGAKIRKAGERIKELYDQVEQHSLTKKEADAAAKVIGDSLIEKTDGFFDHFMDGIDGIGPALQNAIISGDFQGLGETIGGTLAGATANAFEKSIGGLGGSLVGGIAGGLVGMAFQGITSAIGGDVEDPTERRQRTQGTGDVLGSIDEKADSIVSSLDLVSNASEDLVNINTRMLNQLVTLNETFSNVASRTVQAIEDIEFDLPNVGGIDIGNTGLAIAGALDAATLGLAGLFTSGSRSKQIDEGIRIAGGTIQELIDNTLVEAFATFKVRKNYLDDYDVKERFSELGDAVSSQFSQAFSEVADSVVAGAASLGVSEGAIQEALNTVALETQKISLEGLNAAAQEVEIAAVFSQVFNDLSLAVVPNLRELTQNGEEFGEALSRLGTEFSSVEEASKILGLSFIKGQTGLIEASSSLVSKVGGIEAFNRAISNFEKNFLSTEDQLSNQARRLNSALEEIGETLPETRSEFTSLTEGLRVVDSANEDYLATILRIQDSADTYFDLKEQVEGSTDSIEDLVDTLSDLEDAADLASSNTDSALSDLRKAVEAERKEITKQYRHVVKDRKDQLKEEIDDIKEAGRIRTDAIREKARLNANAIKEEGKLAANAIKEEEQAKLKANKLVLDAAKDGLRAIEKELSGIGSALESITEKAFSNERRRSEALNFLISSLESGNLTGAGEAAGVAANINAKDIATVQDYRRQIGVTRSVLSQLEETGNTQKTNAEKVIERLEDQALLIKDTADKALEANRVETDRLVEANRIDRDRSLEANRINTENSIEAAELRAETELALLESQYEDEMARLDLIIKNATDQLDELRGIKSGVINVEEAVSAFGAALKAEKEARKAVEDELAAQKAAQEVVQEEGVVSDIPPEVQTVFDAIGDLQFGNIPDIDVSPSSNLIGVPAFADGGIHSGGMRLVGESGPELEVTGPSRIINNNDLNNMLSNQDLVNQLAQLRQEMNQVLLAIARSSGKTAKQLTRWEGDGLPNLRETQQVETV